MEYTVGLDGHCLQTVKIRCGIFRGIVSHHYCSLCVCYH